jgi:hypothetical protein
MRRAMTETRPHNVAAIKGIYGDLDGSEEGAWA